MTLVTICLPHCLIGPDLTDYIRQVHDLIQFDFRQSPLLQIKDIPKDADVFLEIRRCFELSHIFFDRFGHAR